MSNVCGLRYAMVAGIVLTLKTVDVLTEFDRRMNEWNCYLLRLGSCTLELSGNNPHVRWFILKAMITACTCYSLNTIA